MEAAFLLAVLSLLLMSYLQSNSLSFALLLEQFNASVQQAHAVLHHLPRLLHQLHLLGRDGLRLLAPAHRRGDLASAHQDCVRHSFFSDVD